MKIYLIKILFITSLFSTDYAIIIGINNLGLKSAKNDAIAINRLLKAYNVKGISLLLTQDATKKNILALLNAYKKGLKKGDNLFFFFSGHGISEFEPSIKDKKLLKLLKDSFAFLPYDFNKKDIYNTIISSKRDLAPIYRYLDKKGVNLIIFMDSCFSGNGYKEMLIKTEPQFNTFPYKNLIYFSATTRSDIAIGKIRGVFSDILEDSLYRHRKLLNVKEYIENQNIAQTPLILTKNKNYTFFKNRSSFKKEYLIALKSKNRDLKLTILNEDEEESREFKAGNLLNIEAKSKKNGYLLLFSLDTNRNLSLFSYTKIKAYQNEQIAEIEDLESSKGKVFFKAFLVKKELFLKIKKICVEQEVLSRIKIKNIIKLLQKENLSSDFKSIIIK